MIRKHILFSGVVQGVGFRYHACHKAHSLGLTGWVLNRYDGSVEMEVQGTGQDIDALILHLKAQNYIYIDSMQMKTIPVIEESGFKRID